MAIDVCKSENSLKMAIFDLKWAISDNKCNPRFLKILFRNSIIIHFYVFLIVPEVFKRENSLKKAIFDLKWAIFDQKWNPIFLKIYIPEWQ